MPDVHLTTTDTKVLRDMLKDFPADLEIELGQGVLLKRNDCRRSPFASHLAERFARNVQQRVRSYACAN